MFKQEDRIRVLIVDDAAGVRRDLCLLLEIAGDLRVVGEAENGAEAVEQATALHPDVVIMDLAMPVMDGCQAATRIKSHAVDCRIVALTVHNTETSRQEAYAAGFDAYLVKGAPLAELLGAIGSRRTKDPSETGGLS